MFKHRQDRHDVPWISFDQPARHCPFRHWRAVQSGDRPQSWISHQRVRSLWLHSGVIPAATTVTLGLSAIFNTSALAFQVIRVFGVMYLFYMAWSVWKDSRTRDLEETPALENHLHIAVTGTLINVLNPKLLLFFWLFCHNFCHKPPKILPLISQGWPRFLWAWHL